MSANMKNWNELCLKLNLYPLLLLLNSIIATTLAINPYSEDWGVTQIIAKKISYSWTISNYSLNDKEFRQYLTSPTFSSNDEDNYQWQLFVYPKGINDDFKNDIAVQLKLVSDHKVTIHYTFSIIDGNGRKAASVSARRKYSEKNEMHGYFVVVSQNDLKNKSKYLLPDDKLTVLAEIIINNGTSNISGERCNKLNVDSNAEQMLTLFEDSLYSDVELQADGRVFKAHRGILAAHSSWFSEQFKAYPNRTIFSIEKISSKALKEVLRYIYTGRIENLERIAKELLDVSNWLSISQLKSTCARTLCKTINPKNAIEVLTLAELYDAEDLKHQASKYIAAHASNVVDSPDFKSLQKSNPHPLFEIFRALINRSL